MSKIHPTLSGAGAREARNSVASERTTVWTVWKKSSMAFQGTDGFSMYDSEGRLAFRVDNYSRQHKYLSGELVLMDGVGRALLALRPQILSMHDRWNGFKPIDDRSKAGSESCIFSMRRRSILQQGDEAEVFLCQSATPDFVIEGCFRKRCCKILDNSGEVVAELSRKKVSGSVVLSHDVFSLAIKPSIDCQLMMALVVVMDRICQKPYTPLMCSYS